MSIEAKDKTIYIMQFADSQVLITQDKGDRKYMTRKIKEEYDRIRLTMNMKKTKYKYIGGKCEDLDIEIEKIAAFDI